VRLASLESAMNRSSIPKSLTRVLPLAVALGLVLAIALPIGPARIDFRPKSVALGIAWAVVMSTIALAYLKFLSNRPGGTSVPPVVKSSWWTLSLPSICLWTVILVAFWPGLLSPDSLEQWNEMVTGNYDTWHPVFHTLLNWLITRLVFSPAAIAFVQIVFLALVCAWALGYFREKGLSPAPAWALAGAIALIPTNGIMAITLWKDVPFSIASLWLTVLLLKIIDSRGAYLSRKSRILAVSVAIACVYLLRHNGFLFVVPAIAVLVYASSANRTKSCLAAGIGIFLIGMVVGPMYSLLKVRRVSLPVEAMLAVHVFAAHVAAGTVLRPEQQFLRDTIRKREDWWYECASVGGLFFDGRSDPNLIYRHANDLAKAAVDLSLHSPLTTLRHLICMGSYLYRVRPLANVGYVEGLWVAFEEDGALERFRPEKYGFKFSLSRKPLLDARYARAIYRATSDPKIAWLTLRPATYLLFLLVGIISLAVRFRAPRVLLVLLPHLVNSVSLSLFGPGHTFRYMYPLVLAGLAIGLPALALSLQRPPLAAGLEGRERGSSQSLMRREIRAPNEGAGCAMEPEAERLNEPFERVSEPTGQQSEHLP